MEVILKQDMPNLGYANEIVKVKNGYARNYLIPKGYAILATETNRKILSENIKQKAFKEEKLRKEAETLAKALQSIVVKIGTKAAATGKIYGSVNNIQVAEAIKNQFNYTIDRKKIHIDSESIKEIGTYKAKIHLYKDINVDITFEVVPE
ncbi:MAG TPA: 50S ribosomal protein L9 [Bacteroidales bacterium]|nr:50S ribosomal protein L9 [Bacteroidales bacterium]